MGIDRKRLDQLRAQQSQLKAQRSSPRPIDRGRGEIAGGIAELVAEFEGQPPGGEWVSRLESEFRRLLSRRLDILRLRKATRGRVPADQVEQLRSLIAEFLRETRRLIEAIPARPFYRGSLDPWLRWIAEEFDRRGLAEVWAGIRADLPDCDLENV
jgi:hypothetical protein